jgi:hypothetical protein
MNNRRPRPDEKPAYMWESFFGYQFEGSGG